MKTVEECMLDSYYKEIPKRTIETINDYVVRGWEPGSFVTAVLQNDLIEAINRADMHNVKVLKEIVCYVDNEIPAVCHGSVGRVELWLKDKREEKS